MVRMTKAAHRLLLRLQALHKPRPTIGGLVEFLAKAELKRRKEARP